MHRLSFCCWPCHCYCYLVPFGCPSMKVRLKAAPSPQNPTPPTTGHYSTATMTPLVSSTPLTVPPASGRGRPSQAPEPVEPRVLGNFSPELQGKMFRNAIHLTKGQ